MPVVGLEPISKFMIFQHSSMLPYILYINFHKLYISIYQSFMMRYIVMQHEMQHRNFYKIFLYFGARLTKYLYLPTLSQIIPKSSQLKRFIISFLSSGSSDISDALGHFRTFSEKSVIKSHFSVIKVLYFVRLCPCCVFAAKHATIAQLSRNSDTLTSYKQVK